MRSHTTSAAIQCDLTAIHREYFIKQCDGNPPSALNFIPFKISWPNPICRCAPVHLLLPIRPPEVSFPSRIIFIQHPITLCSCWGTDSTKKTSNVFILKGQTLAGGGLAVDRQTYFPTTDSNNESKGTKWRTCWKQKKDKPRDNEGTKRPLTSLLWEDVLSEMSPFYSWRGQQAHKVKPTRSCYTQHQRQVQRLSCSFWAGLKTAALIPQPARSRGEDRGQLDVQILIGWFNCSNLLNLKRYLWCVRVFYLLDLYCLCWIEKRMLLN